MTYLAPIFKVRRSQPAAAVAGSCPRPRPSRARADGAFVARRQRAAAGAANCAESLRRANPFGVQLSPEHPQLFFARALASARHARDWRANGPSITLLAHGHTGGAVRSPRRDDLHSHRAPPASARARLSLHTADAISSRAARAPPQLSPSRARRAIAIANQSCSQRCFAAPTSSTAAPRRVPGPREDQAARVVVRAHRRPPGGSDAGGPRPRRRRRVGAVKMPAAAQRGAD